MAFVSKTDMVSLKPGIQAVLKKYGMKGTIAGQNSSTVRVTITKGPLDLMGAYRARVIRDAHRELPRNPHFADGTKYALGETSFRLNEYWIEDNYVGEVRDFYLELKAAMEGADFFCEDDAMTDYFHRSHYITINVGNKNGYEYTGEEPEFQVDPEDTVNAIMEQYYGDAA